MIMSRTLRSSVIFTMLAAMFLTGCYSSSNLGSEPEQLAERSRITIQSMLADNQYPGLVDLTSRAKAVIIVPSMIKAGFFVGGRGGNAVMLVRDVSGTWSSPAYYTLGGLSFGLQFGGQASEVVITVMTQRGLNAIMNRRVTLGGDAGLAIGEIGQGVNAAVALGWNADMYAFARSEGLFAGISLEGSWIEPRQSWNKQLYGMDATPSSILVDRTSMSSSPAIGSLVSAMP